MMRCKVINLEAYKKYRPYIRIIKNIKDIFRQLKNKIKRKK